MAENGLVTCPKCGAENEAGTQNCIECHVNLQWATESYDNYVAQVEESKNQQAVQTPPKKSLRKTLGNYWVVIIITMILGGIAGFLPLASDVLPVMFEPGYIYFYEEVGYLSLYCILPSALFCGLLAIIILYNTGETKKLTTKRILFVLVPIILTGPIIIYTISFIVTGMIRAFLSP